MGILTPHTDHVPVLVNEVLSLVREAPIPMDYFLDGTFGRGGHTRWVMGEFPHVKVVAFDRDEEALDEGRGLFEREIREERIHFVHSDFVDVKDRHNEMSSFMGEGSLFSGALLDLGVSSPQLDRGERGFSFYKDGPLDMRMDRSQSFSASDIVNEWSERKLVELFQNLGEVRSPQKVVRAIVQDRKKKKFESTMEFSGLIERIYGWKRRGHHPATQFFLALRLEVNEELEAVERALPHILNLLQEGGRLLVITFHSLEDRIVKHLFRVFEDQGLGFRVNKKVIQASWEEKQKNPRARSAKLRAFQKGELV